MDKNSLRVSEIDEGLRKFTLLVDFEIPQEQMLETVQQAREFLKPLLGLQQWVNFPLIIYFRACPSGCRLLWPG